MTKVIKDPDALMHELISQVWANSIIAESKHRWSSWATAFLLIGLLLIPLCLIFSIVGQVSMLEKSCHKKSVTLR
jgi:hypothetical protein